MPDLSNSNDAAAAAAPAGTYHSEEMSSTDPSAEEGITHTQDNLDEPLLHDNNDNDNDRDDTTAAVSVQSMEPQRTITSEEDRRGQEYSSHPTRMQALEIEDASRDSAARTAMTDIGADEELDDNGNDNDMEGLLEPQKGRSGRTKLRLERPTSVTFGTTRVYRCCETTERVGNVTVFWPYLYHKTGWGMIGRFLCDKKGTSLYISFS